MAESAVRVRLRPDVSSAGAARQLLHDADCLEVGSEALSDAELMVSELVANAVTHGRPPVTVELVCEAAGIRVGVSDTSSAVPELRSSAVDAESGRGVFLVDLLAAEWGIEQGAQGKTVWFRVRDSRLAGR